MPLLLGLCAHGFLDFVSSLQNFSTSRILLVREGVCSKNLT